VPAPAKAHLGDHVFDTNPLCNIRKNVYALKQTGLCTALMIRHSRNYWLNTLLASCKVAVIEWIEIPPVPI